ncbi:MAG: hypothetical protein RBS99_04830 [Rhodospirillales bacterium]|nr:hypothetical protein [Rhodospirillales bacterium]
MEGGIFVVQMDVPPHLEDDFNRIYDTQHIPEITKVPGVRGCVRYRLANSDVAGVPRYMAIYYVDSAEVPNSSAWKAASEKGDWATVIRPHVTNRIRSFLERLPA